jgi:hypothetical protein
VSASPFLQRDSHEQGEHWNSGVITVHSMLTVCKYRAALERLFSRRLQDQELTFGVKQHHELGKSLTPLRFAI